MSHYNLKDLHHFFLLHGYSTDIDKLPLDDSLLAYMKEIAEVDTSCYEGYSLPYVSKLQMTSNAKRFLNEKFRLHPVGFLSNKQLAKVLMDRRIQSVDDIPIIYNQSAKMVDPFLIPIEYDVNSIFGGSLTVQTVVTQDKSFFEDLLPKLNIYFTNISMPKTLTSVAATSYVHEITHSQLESNKGIIENYYNSEVLTIFMEFLHSYEKNPNVFQIDIVNRIQNMLANFYSMFIYESGQKNPEREYSEYDYFSDSKYLISILKAFQLFHLYETSSDSIKKYILEGIQKVFDGKITLEQFLESVDVHYSGSLNPEYAKYFVKK